MVDGDPGALVSHSPEWIDCLCATDGYRDATCLYEAADGRRLVVPLVSRPALPGVLRREWSMPTGWGSGGVVSADPIHPEDLVSICADLRSRRQVLSTFLQPSPRQTALWSATGLHGVKATEGLAHVLDLTGGFGIVWEQRFTGSARTAVRKAEKSGVVVEHDSAGRLLPEFYDLYRASVDRWAQQDDEPLALARWRARRRESLAKFQAIAAAVPSAFHLFLARHEGRSVAGILVYRYGAGASYSRGAMLKELAGPVRANYLLHRVAIEEACREGCQFYDFGESGTSGPLAQFKTRFGAEPVSYWELVVERLPLTEVRGAVRSAAKSLLKGRPSGRGESGDSGG